MSTFASEIDVLLLSRNVFQSSKSLLFRVDNSLDHHYQIAPLDDALWVGFGTKEATNIKHLGVDHKSPTLHSKDLHSRLQFVDEDKDISREEVTFHLIGNQSRECIETFTHITWRAVEPVTH